MRRVAWFLVAVAIGALSNLARASDWPEDPLNAGADPGHWIEQQSQRPLDSIKGVPVIAMDGLRRGMSCCGAQDAHLMKSVAVRVIGEGTPAAHHEVLVHGTGTAYDGKWVAVDPAGDPVDPNGGPNPFPAPVAWWGMFGGVFHVYCLAMNAGL